WTCQTIKKQIPYTTCYHTCETRTKQVPYTKCHYEKHCVTKRIPYCVPRQECYTHYVTKCKVVPRCVTVKKTRCVPRTVCRQVPCVSCAPACCAPTCRVPTCLAPDACVAPGPYGHGGDVYDGQYDDEAYEVPQEVPMEEAAPMPQGRPATPPDAV